MRKLGDQWIEIIDGHEHMVKAVEKVSEKSYDCTGCIFNGHNGTCMYHSQDCPLGEVEYGYIKDLGILNEDGCLTNCWGEYPEIEELVDVHTREHWFRCITRNNVYCATESYKTKQQAIDAWNRRS
jgi:hypothetical protein